MEEDVEFLTWLKTEIGENTTDLHIDEDQGPTEFIGRLSFVIIELLSDGKGAVWCKEGKSDLTAKEFNNQIL